MEPTLPFATVGGYGFPPRSRRGRFDDRGDTAADEADAESFFSLRPRAIGEMSSVIGFPVTS